MQLGKVCGRLGVCPDLTSIDSNAFAVGNGHLFGTDVYTYQNSDDAVYLPASCEIVGLGDYRSTEVVRNAQEEIWGQS